MIDINVGDTVIVTERRRDAREATVTKVGRAWITVDEGWQERRFRLDDQTDGSDLGIPPCFYTLDQWAMKQQRDDASAFLREQGIDLRYESPWHGREVELVTLLRSVLNA